MAEGGIGSEVVVDTPVVDAQAVQENTAPTASENVIQSSTAQEASQPPNIENADQALPAEEAIEDPAPKQIAENPAAEDVAEVPAVIEEIVDSITQNNSNQSLSEKKSEVPVIEKFTDVPVIKDQPDVSESKSKTETIADLENDPDVVEHVSKAEVEALVRKKSEFYKVPQLATEQGLKSEVFVVKDAVFEEFIEKELSTGGAGADDPAIKEHAKNVGGVSVPQEGGGSRIIIKENGPFSRSHSINHELNHAESEDGEGNGGFIRKIEAFIGFENRNINEATTEILTLKEEYPDLSIKEMASKIKTGEIEAGYGDYVLSMLGVINATSQNENPFTINDLANCYYHNYEGEEYPADKLKDELLMKVKPELFDEATQLLYSDLEGVSAKK
jgi:hypothetical protein